VLGSTCGFTPRYRAIAGRASDCSTRRGHWFEPSIAHSSLRSVLHIATFLPDRRGAGRTVTDNPWTILAPRWSVDARVARRRSDQRSPPHPSSAVILMSDLFHICSRSVNYRGIEVVHELLMRDAYDDPPRYRLIFATRSAHGLGAHRSTDTRSDRSAPQRSARRSAISSRSANDRLRPDSGPRATDGIPPPSRNHRTPTAADTPASTAASSLDSPRAIAAQNRWRCSLRPTGGRPGDRIAGRPARSDRRRLLAPIATPLDRALRRPLESALRALV
jgi:hypothetical protein